jgi:hypothetical protein
MSNREQKLVQQTFPAAVSATRDWREVMGSVGKRKATLIAAFMREAVMNPLVFDAALVIALVGYVLLLMAVFQSPV